MLRDSAVDLLVVFIMVVVYLFIIIICDVPRRARVYVIYVQTKQPLVCVSPSGSGSQWVSWHAIIRYRICSYAKAQAVVAATARQATCVRNTPRRSAERLICNMPGYETLVLSRIIDSDSDDVCSKHIANRIVDTFVVAYRFPLACMRVPEERESPANK